MKIFKYLIVGATAASLIMACDEGTTGLVPDTAVADTAKADTVGGGDTGGTDTVKTDTTPTDAGPEVPGADALADTTTPDTTTPDTTTTDEGTPDVDPPDTGTCEPTFGDEITRINGASMPAEAADFNCDANNDGGVDGDDGELNTFLTTGLVAGFININEELTAAVEEGSLVLLADMQGYTGVDGTGITTNVLIGSDIETQPDPSCGIGSDIDGVCDWNVSPSSYDGCDPVVTVPGCTVSGGSLDCGPADFQFSLPLGGLTLDLEITSGRVNGDVATGATLSSGRLCGSVAKQNIVDAVAGACSAPDAPSFCGTLDLIPGGIGALMDCGTDEICTIVLGLDGNPTGTVTLGE